MAKFLMQELVLQGDVVSARLGAGNGAGNYIDDKEVGKIVKLAGESRYTNVSVGDKIEGFVKAVEPATLDDFSFGAVQVGGRKEVTFDGLEATPGTGVVAVGDFVVAGTIVAKGTALAAPVKVCKATNQPFAVIVLADNVVATINAGLVKAADASKNATFAWRVVSLGSAATGAVGTVGVIERVSGK